MRACQDIGLGTTPMRLENITSSMTSEEGFVCEHQVTCSGRQNRNAEGMGNGCPEDGQMHCRFRILADNLIVDWIGKAYYQTQPKGRLSRFCFALFEDYSGDGQITVGIRAGGGA